MIWTFNEARARGYSVDEKALNEITSWAFGDMKTNSLAEEAPPRNVVNLGWVYVLLSMETSPSVKLYSSKAAGVRAAEQLGSADGQANATAWHTLVQQIANKQAPDGGWGHPLDERVPLGGPVEDIAVLCRLALLESGDSSESVTNSISKASEWLQHNADKTSRQNRNLRLLMNLYEKKRQSELKPVIQAILAEQNADGGWSQTREMTSDAYATGQTLYVLARAGVKPKVPAMRRGVDFLVRTQRSDGSWPMISRVKAKDLSPITGAGTAWALLGVLRASN
ncbi:MAG TPA: prenyltransferase/squalene oxidase repeat-containing protein [Patescibacteria group bacterium]|nr:prenyltransferase/squalene oxidase repeat-containing protein [Patescibacteria group bacterium]